MKDKVKNYLDSLILTPSITYQISGNEADQIYCVSFFHKGDREVEPLADTLISSWDRESEWKFKLRDMYMECIALVTGDSQILRDRYKKDCDD